VVYLKRLFGDPEYVLQYLGRYTHRVAISNHRLVSFADGQVTFRWRDSADHDKQKPLPLSVDEFLCRFLLHILPQGFVRIQNFGFLANRRRKTLLPLCFHLLGSAHGRRARSLALFQVWWPHEGRRTADGGRNPTPLSAAGHRRSMNSLSAIRVPRVPRHGPYLSAFSPNRSLRSASSVTLFKILCCRSQQIAPSCQVLRSVAQSPRTPTPFLPTIEFA
jgi:hypothetical protein